MVIGADVHPTFVGPDRELDVGNPVSRRILPAPTGGIGTEPIVLIVVNTIHCANALSGPPGRYWPACALRVVNVR